MPIINLENLESPSVDVKKLSNTRDLILNFYADHPDKRDYYMEYYSHDKTHEESKVRQRHYLNS